MFIKLSKSFACIKSWKKFKHTTLINYPVLSDTINDKYKYFPKRFCEVEYLILALLIILHR
jgi:hypothetical protein